MLAKMHLIQPLCRCPPNFLVTLEALMIWALYMLKTEGNNRGKDLSLDSSEIKLSLMEESCS
jgi:hypothetical protein